MLAEVVFEQKELGNPTYGCGLGGTDFAEVAVACGAEGFRCSAPGSLQSALAALLASARTAVLEVLVNPAEPVTMPGQLKA